MVKQVNLVTQQAVGPLGQIGRQWVRVLSSTTRRQEKLPDVGTRTIFNRPADLGRNRALEGDAIRSPHRHGPRQMDGVADAPRRKIEHGRWQVQARRQGCSG